MSRQLGERGKLMPNEDQFRVVSRPEEAARPPTRIELLEKRVVMLDDDVRRTFDAMAESIRQDLDEIREAIGLKR